MNRALYSSAYGDWETPPELFAHLSEIHGPFDLDVCATSLTAKVERFYSPAEDGLVQPWHGRCWMNPPYGRAIARWVAKARAEAQAGRATVVALIPARTDTSYWHDHVIGGGAEVTFLRGRIRFYRAGEVVGRAPFPSAVVVWRATAG